MAVARIRQPLRPDPDVVHDAEKALRAAKDGRIRTFAMITVNPVNEVEITCAGDLSDVRKTALLGGLLKLGIQLMKRP
jgi:hypothetical protein